MHLSMEKPSVDYGVMASSELAVSLGPRCRSSPTTSCATTPLQESLAVQDDQRSSSMSSARPGGRSLQPDWPLRRYYSTRTALARLLKNFKGHSTYWPRPAPERDGLMCQLRPPWDCRSRTASWRNRGVGWLAMLEQVFSECYASSSSATPSSEPCRT